MRLSSAGAIAVDVVTGAVNVAVYTLVITIGNQLIFSLILCCAQLFGSSNEGCQMCYVIGLANLVDFLQ